MNESSVAEHARRFASPAELLPVSAARGRHLRAWADLFWEHLPLLLILAVYVGAAAVGRELRYTRH